MEFCNGVRFSSRYSADREAKKAKIRAELLARRERRILEEEVRRELGWEREEAPVEPPPTPVVSSWDKFYDYEPEAEGWRWMGSVDRRIVDADVGFENSRALREAKKKKIRAELLARRERQVLEEEVRRELGLEWEEMSWDKIYDYAPEVEKSRALRDDGCLVPRLGFERRRHLPTLSNDMLRTSPAVERSASPPAEENIQPLPSFPDFLPLNGAEPELSSKPSLVVADSVSKPCVEPVSSPKPSPMVISAVYEPELVPENKPSSNNYSGNKRKFACDLCQIAATSKESLDDHFNGKRHKAMTASDKSIKVSALKSSDRCSSAEAEKFNKPKNRPAEFLCKVCGLKCGSKSILHAHINEKRHWLRSTGN